VLWQIIFQIVAMVVLVLTALLDYRFHDKRTSKFKLLRAVLLYGAIPICLIAGIWSVIVSYRATARDQKVLADSLTAIRKDAKGLQEGNRELQAKLDPFINLAKQRYPDSSLPRAIQLLQNELTEQSVRNRLAVSQVQALEEVAKDISLLLKEPMGYPKRNPRLTEYLLPENGGVASAYYIIHEKIGGEFGIGRLPPMVRSVTETFLSRVEQYLVNAQTFDRAVRDLTERTLEQMNLSFSIERFHDFCAVRAKWMLLGYSESSIKMGLDSVYSISFGEEDKKVADAVAKDTTIRQRAAEVKRQAAQLSLKDVRELYDAVAKYLDSVAKGRAKIDQSK
jgi:hypothetical protein